MTSGIARHGSLPQARLATRTVVVVVIAVMLCDSFDPFQAASKNLSKDKNATTEVTEENWRTQSSIQMRFSVSSVNVRMPPRCPLWLPLFLA